MASSSSSSGNSVYDVFPSFRGEDIRQNFLSHFLKELDRKLITSFKDHEIERSRSLDPELKQAIRASRIAVVIFSAKYASSSWCLNELLEIVRCKQEFGQLVIPLFYRLDPSDVRKQTGDFGKFFEKTCKNRSKEDKIRWKKALTDVANIHGYHYQNWDSEATMIETIANDLLGKLNVTPSNDFEDYVGLEDHFQKMSELLELESKEVRMVGIWGLSGIGKTTIARVLYNRISRHFQNSMFIDKQFIAQLYSSGNPDDYNMKLHLQGKFLSKLLGKEGIEVDRLGVLREKLMHLKVLICIDDLDDKMVLNALVGQNEWFGSGSRIILVTRDKNLLEAHGIDHIYEVDFPSEKVGLEMFCRSAFGKNSPPQGFEKLAVEVSQLAGRLPLSISLLGSSLRGREKEGWMKMLPRIRNNVDGEIGSILRFSYEGLNRKEKALFRHIACLFNFEKVGYIKLLLADRNLDFEIGLGNLVSKSLVNVILNIVEMPSLLQKLGKEIVREQSDEPGEREFLTDSIDILDVLKDTTGTKKVIGISLNIDETDQFNELYIDESAFKNMPNLRFLTISTKKVRLHLPDTFDHLPPRLKLLCWDEYPMKSLPSMFCPARLVKIQMKNSKLKKLWEGSRNLPCLKEVNLWGSENLKEIPDLSKATNLEKLYVGYRLSWVPIPSYIQKFNNLRKVETLPTGINLESPKSSIVADDFCMENFEIEKLSEGIQPLMYMGRTLPASSTVLFLSDIPNMVELPFSIDDLNKLTDLRIIRCKNLEVLPTPINLVALERLNLSGCSRLKTFPDISRNISSLNLEETAIKVVPPSIENFTKLKYLNMQGCSKLEYVYLNVSKLKHLESVNFSHCGALTGADWNGGIALEGDIIDMALEASTSIPDNNVSKVDFSFINCFNLDGEALIQQLSYEKLILSGDEMPLYFTHRTSRTSMAFPLVRTPHSPPFFRFRACAAAVFNSMPTFGAIGVYIKVNCQFRSRLGSHYDSHYHEDYFSVYQTGSHLLLLDCVIPLNKDNATPTEVDYDYVDIKFHMSSGNSKFKLKEWGIRLSEDCSSVKNRLGNPNTIPQICEADEDNVVNTDVEREGEKKEANTTA